MGKYGLAVSLAVTCALSVSAQAKDVINRETYGDALSYLLDLRQGVPPFVTCRLFGEASNSDPGALEVTPGLFDGLSQGLIDHCGETGTVNSNSAAALGGGFGSTQSTRTVSQFDEQMLSDEESASGNQTGDGRFNFGRGLELSLDNVRKVYGEDGSISYSVISTEGVLNLSEQSPTGTIRWSSDNAAVFFTYRHEETDRKATKYQDGFESDSDRFTGGATMRLTENFAIGALGFYGEGDGKYDGAGAVFPLPGGDDVSGLLDTITFEQACGISQVGDEEHDEFGGSIFGAYTTPEGWFATNELTAQKFKSKSTNSLCLLQTGVAEAEPEPIRRIYRGYINGEPEGFTLSESLVIGRRFAFGFLSVSPRLGADISWTKIDDYEETETEAPGVRPELVPDSDGDNVPGRVVNHTGAALAYEDQDYLSVRSRLGFVASVPIITDTIALIPFGEAYYIHEFANDQEEIVAHFAGDNRDDPTYFSFKTNKPDRDYFEVAGGLSFQAAAFPLELSVGVRALLGNNLYDYYQVEGGLRVPF